MLVENPCKIILNNWLDKLIDGLLEAFLCELFIVKEVAPDAGFEPATKWLTATYSTAELIRNKQRARLYIKLFLLSRVLPLLA